MHMAINVQTDFLCVAMNDFCAVLKMCAKAPRVYSHYAEIT